MHTAPAHIIFAYDIIGADVVLAVNRTLLGVATGTASKALV